MWRLSPASRPSSSSARRSAPAPGRTRPRAGTRPLQADGQYDLRVVTTDNAGNSHTSATITVRVDNTNPTGSITAPADSANVRGTVGLTSNSADAGGSGVATVQFQRSPIGAGTWTNQAASWDTTAQADGQYDLRVVTTDNAGNTHTSATITVRVDNTAPTATMGNPGADLSGTVTLTSTTNDGGSGIASITYQLSPANANTWTNQAASWDTTGSADGLYDLRVIAVDNAGNSTTSAVVEDRRVDNNAPAIDITAPVGIVNASDADPFTVTASSPDADMTQVEFFECPTPACGSQTLDRRGYDCPVLGLPCDSGGRLLDAQGRRHRQRPEHDQRHRDGRRRPDTPADHGRLEPGRHHEPDRRHLHLQLE